MTANIKKAAQISKPIVDNTDCRYTVKVERRAPDGRVDVIELSGWVGLEDILLDVQCVAERGGWTAAKVKPT